MDTPAQTHMHPGDLPPWISTFMHPPTQANTNPRPPLSLLSIRVVCFKPQLQSRHPSPSTVKFKGPLETHSVIVQGAVGEVNSFLGLKMHQGTDTCRRTCLCTSRTHGHTHPYSSHDKTCINMNITQTYTHKHPTILEQKKIHRSMRFDLQKSKKKMNK